MVEIPARKKINGKWYTFDSKHHYKYDAEQKAGHLRAGTYYARVVRQKGVQGYIVYFRVKPVYGR